jgi:hypothetical protein
MAQPESNAQTKTHANHLDDARVKLANALPAYCCAVVDWYLVMRPLYLCSEYRYLAQSPR